MPNILDSLPSAVASIVNSVGLQVIDAARDPKEVKEKKLLEFTDKVTRTLGKAMLDLQNGEPWPK